MSKQCDWTNLMDVLDQTEVFKKKKSKQKKPKKKVYDKNELSTKAKFVYEHILKKCPTDNDILKIYNLIQNGVTYDSKKISGRTIDTLVTQVPKYSNACYYLDVTNPNDIFIVESLDHKKKKKIILFDIGSSYRKKMQQYSKAYFDCFKRGELVSHKLENGEYINISLCQYNFFIWASHFKVFEYLMKIIDTITNFKQIKKKRTNIISITKKVFPLPMIECWEEIQPKRQRVVMSDVVTKKKKIYQVKPLNYFIS